MADNLLDVEIVAEDHFVWSGQARSVSARTIDGEVVILPGHLPMLAVLGDGEVVVEAADGEPVTAQANGGGFSVDSNRVTIAAAHAELYAEMPSWLAWSLTGVALVVLLTVVVIAWRLITLLRTPGSFKARLVSKAGDSGYGKPVVVSYNEYSVEIFAVYSVWPRPRVSVPRHCLDVT